MSETQKNQPEASPEVQVESPVIVFEPIAGPALPEIPHEELFAKLRSGELQFGGNADGVFFLDEVVDAGFENGDFVRTIIEPSLELQAIRYLRPVDPVWKRRHPRMIGIGRPDVIGLCPKALKRYAKEREQPVTHLFVMDGPRGIEANQKDHYGRWQVREAEAGIWCVFYV